MYDGGTGSNKTVLQDGVLKNINTINDGSITGYNYVINGAFDIWQRGVSFAGFGYGPDRFVVNPSGGGSTGTVTRQTFTAGQTSVPGNPSYYCRIARTVAASSTTELLVQKIENVRHFNGKNVTVSFWAMAAAAKSGVYVDLIQNFGSGGSSEVNLANQSIDLTTSWQQFTLTFAVPSISGKSIGSGSYLSMRIVEGGSYSTFTIDVANVKLELGDVATDFIARPIADELALCQRYFWKTYDTTYAPGTASYNGARYTMTNGGLYATWSIEHGHMRTNPTITFYAPGSGNSGVVTVNGADVAPTLSSGGASQTGFRALGVGSYDHSYAHITADAEL
jgi:hypothetical protein